MAIEIKVGDRIAWVDLRGQDGNLLEIEVDGKILKVDVMHTADGTFSILESGRSYNIELVPHNQPKKYTAHTLYQEFEVEIIDAEARYLLDRGTNTFASSEKKISSPMPGKVVKVFVNEGDEVTEGQTAIVISAMKMESEYKIPMDGKIKKVNVKDGDTIEGNQILIELE
ncbi:acetyl-CoA carboxylase biotin carboxyl carrier protein subunit [Draconibacterium sp.]|jgi:biotin carboxyl carrier protein